MPCNHEFGIIDCLEEYDEHKYEPKKYNCINVDDDLLGEIYHDGLKDKIKKLKTFAHNPQRPFTDLAYCGTTLIPPSSLQYFLDIISEVNENYESIEFKRLEEKIIEAKEKDKWMIHYGI